MQVVLPPAIGQAVEWRPEVNADTAGNPFGDEMDAGFALAADVSADVQKMLLPERMEQEVKKSRPARQPHAAHGKEHQAYRGAAIKEIQFEWNRGLQLLWREFQMHHAQRFPIADEQSVTFIQRKHRAMLP